MRGHDDDLRDDEDDANDTLTREAAWQPSVGPAPDPYEHDPEARRRALAPLVDPERKGAVVAGSLRFLRGTGDDKLDLILSLPDPGATIQALSPEEFVLLIKDVGLADAGELLTLASQRQLQACVDLDAWQGDKLDVQAFGAWLITAAQAGEDVVERFVAAQEDGVLCLYLSGSIQIGFPEEDDTVPDGMESFLSPDNTMMLLVEPNDPQLPAIRKLIDVAYRQSLGRGRTILKALRWELPSQLEEDLYTFRSTRIDEYGFMPRDEALAMYAYRDPNAWRDELHETYRRTGAPAPELLRPYLPADEPPRLGLAVRGGIDEGFLGQAIAAMTADQQDRLRLAMTRLAYRVQAGRAAKPSEWSELAHWSRHAVQTCTMGLEHLSRGDVAFAALLLTLLPVSEVFQAGNSLVLIEHMRARRLRQSLGGESGLALLEPADAAMVRAMSLGFPGLPRAVAGAAEGAEDTEDDADADAPASAAPDCQPIASLAELAGVRERLLGLAGVVRLASRLAGGELGATAQRLARGRALAPKLTSLLNTAIAWQILRGAPDLEPLGVDDLRAFLRQAMAGAPGRRVVRGELRAALTTALLAQPGASDEEVEALGRYLAAALGRLGEELGGLDPEGSLDLRFVGGALVVAGG